MNEQKFQYDANLGRERVIFNIGKVFLELGVFL